MLGKRRNFVQTLNSKKYASRQYANPYFKKQRRPKKIKILMAASVVAAILIFILFFTSPIYKINNIMISCLSIADNKIVQQSVEAYLSSKRYLFIPMRHALFFIPEPLKEKLLQDFAFESVNIKIEGSTLVIQANERTVNMIWESGGRKFLADMEGVIISEVKEDINQNNPERKRGVILICRPF